MSILSFLFRSSKKACKAESTLDESTLVKSSDVFKPLTGLEDCGEIARLRKSGNLAKALSMALSSIEAMEEHAPHAEQAFRDNDRATWESMDIGPYDPTEIDIIANEQAGRVPWGVTPAYYEQAAMVYRKRKDYAAEVDILQRFAQMEHCLGSKVDKLLVRLERATELMQRAVSKS